MKRIESNQEVLSLKLDNALNMLRTLVQAKHLSNSGRQLTNIRLPLTTVDEFKAMHEALRTNRELQEDLVHEHNKRIMPAECLGTIHHAYQ